MFREVTASEFIASTEQLQLLAKTNRIVLDDPKYEQSEHTTEELQQCFADIRVCGGGELRKILAWRKKLIEENKKEKEAA